jgi:hypothetical protein
VLFRNGATNACSKSLHFNLFLLDFTGAIGPLFGMGAAKRTAEIALLRSYSLGTHVAVPKPVLRCFLAEAKREA